MIGGLQPYPVMKDSGVPWLGEVPEHWEVRGVGGLGALFKGNGGNKSDEVPTGIPCVRYGDLYTRHEFFVTASKACISNERAGAYTSIRHGDVLFAASGETIEDIGRSAVNLIEGEARCGGDILVLRPEVPVVPRYLGYASDSPASRHQKACMGRGFTVVHIYGGELKRLALPLPPLPEQAAIVRFLDHADRRIRRYIRAKQKLIKLLEEQKQAIIHRAVTRGLDPNVRLKPSGVEWLGDVPEHWDVRRCKMSLKPVDHRSTTGLEPLLSLRREKGIVLYEEHFSRPAQASSLVGYKIVEPGQVVVNRLQANNGLIFRSGMRGLTSPDYSVLEVGLEVNAEFIAFVLRTPHYRVHFRRVATGLGTGTSGFLRLYDDQLLNTPVCLPPHAEQGAILRQVDRETESLITAGALVKRDIDLLREYRTRLIADVVTGKLDVREAASLLPDEVEEPEAVDDIGAEGDPDEAGVDDTDAVPEEVEA